MNNDFLVTHGVTKISLFTVTHALFFIYCALRHSIWHNDSIELLSTPCQGHGCGRKQHIQYVASVCQPIVCGFLQQTDGWYLTHVIMIECPSLYKDWIILKDIWTNTLSVTCAWYTDYRLYSKMASMQYVCYAICFIEWMQDTHKYDTVTSAQRQWYSMHYTWCILQHMAIFSLILKVFDIAHIW